MKIIKQIIIVPLRKVQCNWGIIKYTLLLLCKTNQWLFYFIIFFTVVGGICPAALLIINQTLINTVQMKDIANINFSLYPFVLLSFLNILVQHIVNLLSNRFSMLLSYRVNCLIIEKCSNLSLKHLEKSEIYNMITRLENETPVKPYEIFHSFLLFFQTLITFSSVSVILFTWKFWILISVMFLISLNIIIDVKLGNQEFEMKFQRSELERKSWYYSFLLTKDVAFKEIKIFGLKNFFLKKYKKIKSQFIKQDCQLYAKRTKVRIAISAVHECFVVIITIVAIKEIIYGNILLGTGLSYLLAATLIEGNISQLSQQVYSIYQSSLYMRLLKSFLTLPIESELSFCEL
jgi:ABC-type multidrug transport system fused ATPase/permease subunit